VKFDTKKMDIESLDELIAKCEDSMVEPFKKKKAMAVEVEPESEEMTSEDDADTSEKPDMNDMDLEDLVRMYSEMKEKG
jgi:hypothetical protein